MKNLNDINPESFYQEFSEEIYDRDEDVTEESRICEACKGQIIDGKCIYGCDDVI
jgi:hypothetical protein